MKINYFSLIRILSKYTKIYTRFFLILFGLQFLAPLKTFALTSGPSNPDFSSFEPVTTNSMVNESSGDFTYNLPILDVPGANGGGYSMSLSYHSGNTPETEASWVGYGWTLNPGAVNRQKDAIADDAFGETLENANALTPNKTIATQLGAGCGLEIYSLILISANAHMGIRYNNYRGIGISKGVSLGAINGAFNLGYDVVDNQGLYNWSVNIYNSINAVRRLIKSKKDIDNIRNQIKCGVDKKEKKEEYNRIMKDRYTNQKASENAKARTIAYAISNLGSSLGSTNSSSYYFGIPSQGGMFSMPNNNIPYHGVNINGTVQLTVNPGPVQVGLNGALSAGLSYASQKSYLANSRSQYGYLYAGNASYDPESNNLMDYHLEKEASFNARDKFLNIPYASPDKFSLTGEGLSGGFRFHKNEVSFFRPAFSKSVTDIYGLGVDVHVGWDFGAGATGTFGQSKYKVMRPDNENNYSYSDMYENSSYSNAKSKENYFLHYNNDKGGNISFGDPYTKTQPFENGGGNLGSFSATRTDNMDGLARSGASSFLNFHTNEEMKVTSTTGKLPLAYEKSSEINSLAGRSAGAGNTGEPFNKKIGEIVSYNESGLKYVYGLPVYATVESSTTIQEKRNIDIPTPTIGNNNYFSLISASPSKLESRTDKTIYATNFLLTQITTPDYIDKTMDGPSDDDLGGYTRFSYRAIHATTNKDYTSPTNSPSNLFYWRIPYTGTFNSQGTFTKSIDDMHSYTSGYKEIYNLSKIETKTHVAVFVTNNTNLTLGAISINGSGISRKDGIEANASNQAGNDLTSKGTKRLENLERIELYAKGKDQSGNITYQLVKKTFFEYSYEVWPNTLNSESSGKLTLKKVWTEYNGISNAKILPYKFEYTYPTDYPSVYSNLEITGLAEQPDYSIFNDGWSYYQKNGLSRLHNYMPWNNQLPDNDFDPAAWELKKIILPSGGEIHVQYEQGDYAYVQDKDACAMVNLIGSANHLNDKYNEKSFPLDVESTLGITTLADKQTLVNKINNVYKDDVIYFKFLYSAKDKPNPDINSCTSEYVDGYVPFDKCELQGTQVILFLKGNYQPYSPNPAGRKKVDIDLPVEIAESFVKEEIGAGLKSAAMGCDENNLVMPNNNSVPGFNMLKSLAKEVREEIKNLSTGEFLCKYMNYPKSYFKIPISIIRNVNVGGVAKTLRGKQGGGIRVKRILMYDKGIDANDKSLYGTEYIYMNSDGVSSGVATNEPAAIEMENSLISILDKREPQTLKNRKYAGMDKQQFEGPIGENLLPSASVTYSRVIAKSINPNLKTGTGFTINEFETTKDYPLSDGVYYSEVNKLPFKRTIPIIIGALKHKHYKASQGYTFVLNNMNGLSKKTSTYSGHYTIENDIMNRLPPIVSSVENTYFKSPKHNEGITQQAEKVPIYNFKTYDISYEDMGKEMEVAIEEKEIKEVSYDVGITGDITYAPPFFFYPIALPAINRNANVLYTTVTNKITSYPAILKSVKVFKEGYSKTINNIAFDKYTGNAVITQVVDDFDGYNLNQSGGVNHVGLYTSYTIPASSQYKEMSQRALTEDYVTNSGVYAISNVPGTNYKNIPLSNAELNHFTFGDFVQVNTGGGAYYCHVNKVDYTSGNLQVVEAGNYTSSPLAGNATSIRIVNSGRTNQLTANVGNYTRYGKLALTQYDFLNTFNAMFLPSSTGGTINMSDYGFKLSTVLSVLGGNGYTQYDVYDKCLCDVFFPQYPIAPPNVISSIVVSKNPVTNDFIINFYDQSSTLFASTDISLPGLQAGGAAVLPIPSNSLFSFSQATNAISNTSSYKLDVNYNGTSSSNILYVAGNATSVACYPYQLFNMPSQYAVAIMMCPGSLDKENVIEASAITMKGDWSNGYNMFNTALNEFENGAKGRWYPFESYVYREDITHGDKDIVNNERIYKDAGVFPFVKFNWKTPLSNSLDKWIKTNTNTSITNDGNIDEEIDNNSISSAAKYGYNGMLPYMVAANAKKNDIYFDAFEYIYSNGGLKFENNLAVPNTSSVTFHIGNGAHTGKGCIKITPSSSSIVNFPLWQNMANIPAIAKHMKMKAWIKMDDKNYEAYTTFGGTTKQGPLFLELNLGTAVNTIIPFTFVSRSGDWALIEAVYDLPSNQSNYSLNISASINTNSNAIIYIDDIKVQPSEAQASTYVFDTKSHKLITSFDDRHFGIFYQYDAQGKLIRKIAETERGKKTITETLYNTAIHENN